MSDTIRNYLVQQRQRLIMALLATSLLACGFLNDVSGTVNTVDDAVALLQDLNKNGTWETISDGLDGLADQQQGYTAVVHLRDGAMDASGNFASPLKTDLMLEIQSDTAGNALITVTEGDQIITYFVQGYRSPSATTQVNPLENELTACFSNSAQATLLQGGLHSVFEQYALRAAGAQLLSVAQDKDEDTRIADRDATHYELESKVSDALKILEKIDNQELRQKIEQTGQFGLSGSLDIDQDTGALLRFESVYDTVDEQRRTEFSFEITQWGKLSNFPIPTPDQFMLACP
jgi:hypothetical protein